MKNRIRILILIILLGLAIRLILIPLPGFKFDMDAWFAWALRLNQFGFSNFYSDQIWTNYPPGFLYLLYFLGALRNLFHLSDTVLYLLIKIPSILAEVLLGIFVYTELSKKSVKWGIIAALAILLNPAFIFNSSIWGQIDGLLSLLIVLSVYFLNKNKIVFASIFFSLAFLVKPQAVAVLPLFILYLIKHLSLKNISMFILPAFLTTFILSLTFFINQPLTGLAQLFFKMFSDYSYTSLYAYNFWGVVGFWINDSQTWQILSYQHWGQIMLTIYWGILLYQYFKGKLSVYSTAALATLAFFFLPTRIHERYLYPGLVFLIIAASQFKSRLIILLTIILNLFHFLNLYYVYIFYNEIYLKLPKTLYIQFIYNFLDNKAKFLSLITTIIFALISIIIIKTNARLRKN